MKSRCAHTGRGAREFAVVGEREGQGEGEGEGESEGEGEGEDGDDDLRRAYERARGKMAARVAALTEAHAANRADRIKLLTNLVTASRMESWQNQSSLPNRE